MTDAEQQAFKAENEARMASREMTGEEAKTLAKAWRELAEYETASAALDEARVRLARATGCPNNKPFIPWRIKRGLVADWQNRVPLPTRELVLDDGVVFVEELDRYRLTKKGEEMLRFVGSKS